MRTFFLVLFLISATYADDYIEFTDFTMASSFNDFAAIEFNVEGVYALEEIVWGTTSTTYVDYIIDFYNGSSWDLVAVSNDFVNNPTPPIYNPLYFDDDATVPDIWVKGNGTFRISVFGVAWLGYDEVDDHTFTVTDDTAPASIANAAKSWSSSHPHISWDANTEIDCNIMKFGKNVTQALGH